MIERNISLASTGSARTSGCDNQLRLGYSRNRGIYRLNITQTGEWEGMTIRALWHTERGMLFSSLVEDGKIEVPAIVTSTPGCGRLVFEGSDGTRTLTSADIKYSVAMNSGTQAAKEAGNMVDLDSSPTKLIDIVRIGKQLLMTRGSLTTFSIANDVAKYFAIIPALFLGLYPGLEALNIMNLHSPQSAILSAIIYNALIIIALIPLALKGVKYREVPAGKLLSHNLLIYGLGGLIAPFIFIKIIDVILVLLGLA